MSQQLSEEEVFAMLPQRAGEVRTVNSCNTCGNLVGRRFIPYGLGIGMTVNPCHCQLTGSPGYKKLAERRP